MDEEYNPEEESWEEYQQRIIGNFVSMNMDNILYIILKLQK